VSPLLQDLENMFSRYGRIIDIRLNRDRFTGRCKGFAFVAMSREEEVEDVSAGDE
jgi:nucleolin